MSTKGTIFSAFEETAKAMQYDEVEDIFDARQRKILTTTNSKPVGDLKLSETIAKFKETLEAAKLKIQEQDDQIQQLVGGPKVSGMVLEVAPLRYERSEFKKGDNVRILRGPYAGRFGQQISDISQDGEAFVKFPGDKVKQKFQFVSTFERPALKRYPGTDMEQEIKNPEPSEYTVNTLVEVDGEWHQVWQAVNPEGNIIYLDGQELTELYVGRDELVVPEGKTAGVAFVLIEGRIVEMKLPREGTLRRGDMVSVSPMTYEIISIGGKPSFGETVIFEQYSEDGLLEVSVGSSQTTKLVYSMLDQDLEKGDRISLDFTNSLALKVLPREIKAMGTVKETGVSWADIGGQEKAKDALQEAVEFPALYAEYYAHYNKKPLKGVLLYGPPGTGKTMLGKATVTALAAANGKETAGDSFIYVKGPEILSQWVGAAESKVRALFEQARAHKEKHGFPAVIFIDEADAILGKRGSMRSSDVDKTIVPMFLAEMDGLEESGALVLLATNRPDSLDPAVTREGRIDRKVKVDRPDMDASKKIFTIYLSKTPIAEGTIEEIADMAVKELFSPLRGLYTIEYKGGAVEAFTLGKLASGAMIAGIVDTATTIALRRDIANGTKTGVKLEDLVKAIDEAQAGNADTNHEDDLVLHVGDRSPLKIRKMKQEVEL